MRIGLITSLNTNIGDDFIREGVCLLLEELYKGEQIEFVSINKHKPLSIYPRWHPLIISHSIGRYLPFIKKIFRRITASIFHRLGFTSFDKCDLIVQCGTPVLWPGCNHSEWADPLWHKVVGRLSAKGRPVWNLAAGSCYPWEKQPEKITEEKDVVFLKKIMEYCSLTTVRDRLALDLLIELGKTNPFIPCPALFSGKPYITEKKPENCIIINYMKGAGHYDWDQKINSYTWEKTVKEIIKIFKKEYKILFLCHDQKEVELATKLAPTIPCKFPKDSSEYFDIVSRAKVSLCNRLHASIAMAGIGVPSVVVGNDTRMLMVKAIGLPCMYVKEASTDNIKEELNFLLQNRDAESERLIKIRDASWNEYLTILKKTCSQ